tara:strand:- start:884 stop:1450 length:567 start_codon:yes stop_codon:yes gene_type:complete
MIKIGITGSIASGKTTASKFISKGVGPLFNADFVVKKLYRQRKFKNLVARLLGINSNLNFKKEVKKKILEKKQNLKKLEKIIHPLVRKEMIIFLNKHANKKMLFCEIPLLIENKLTKYFDVVIFIKTQKRLRLKRYRSNAGDNKIFFLLNKQQFKDNKKMLFCDHIVVNNKSLVILKKKLSNIMKLYE